MRNARLNNDKGTLALQAVSKTFTWGDNFSPSLLS